MPYERHEEDTAYCTDGEQCLFCIRAAHSYKHNCALCEQCQKDLAFMTEKQQVRDLALTAKWMCFDAGVWEQKDGTCSFISGSNYFNCYDGALRA